jgi:hypothetical protein
MLILFRNFVSKVVREYYIIHYRIHTLKTVRNYRRDYLKPYCLLLINCQLLVYMREGFSLFCDFLLKLHECLISNVSGFLISWSYSLPQNSDLQCLYLIVPHVVSEINIRTVKQHSFIALYNINVKNSFLYWISLLNKLTPFQNSFIPGDNFFEYIFYQLRSTFCLEFLVLLQEAEFVKLMLWG